MGDAWAQVGDFGLSTRLFGLSALKAERGTAMFGINPRWAAPEVLNGSKYTTKSDVYAMGIMLWELWTGDKPFLNEIMSGEVKHENLLKEFVIAGGRPNAELLKNEKVKKLTEECWKAEANERPTFVEVYNALRNIGLDIDASLFSQLATLVEEEKEKKKGLVEATERLQRVEGEESKVKWLNNVEVKKPLTVRPHQIRLNWISKAQVSSCMSCVRKFSYASKGRHCRSCGSLFCKKCVSSEVIPWQSTDERELCCSTCRAVIASLEGRGKEEKRNIGEWHVRCMAVLYNRYIWCGFRSGFVGVVDVEKLEEPMILCQTFDAHEGYVDVMAVNRREGLVWSACTSGTVRVWDGQVKSMEDVIDQARKEAWLDVRVVRKKRLPGLSAGVKTCWVKLNGGRLEWYPDRYEGPSAGALLLKDVHSIGSDPRRQRVTIVTNDQMRIFLEAASLPSSSSSSSSSLPSSVASSLTITKSKEAETSSVSEWIDVLQQVHWLVEQCKTSNSSFTISGSLHYKVPGNEAFKALSMVEENMWSVGSDLMIVEWKVNKDADRTGK